MIWTYLRSCYGFPMRVFICGVEHRVKARWFFCLPGAKYFPSAHGAEASVWLQNFEINQLWGEVTPWPQDPTPPNTWRVLDHGANPGYAGQCYVGERQWFTDGMLPCDILSRPTLPFPACCLPRTGQTVSGLTLGGTAIVTTGPRVDSAGGIVLGGSAVTTPRYRVLSAGGLVLGGSADPGPIHALSAGGLVLGGAARAAHPAMSAGGLVLGGAGIGTAGGIVTTCCPGLPIPRDLTWTVTPVTGCGCFAGRYPMSYDPGSRTWITTGYGPCGVPPVVILGSFTCSDTEGFIISGDGGLFFHGNPPTSIDCTPGSFRVAFSGVAVTGACTGTVDMVVSL